MSRLLRLKNVSQLVQVCSARQTRLCGKAQDALAVIENAGVVVDAHGNIEALDSEAAIEARFGDASFARVIDCAGKSLVPGFVDAHTHPGAVPLRGVVCRRVACG